MLLATSSSRSFPLQPVIPPTAASLAPAAASETKLQQFILPVAFSLLFLVVPAVVAPILLLLCGSKASTSGPPEIIQLLEA